MCCIKTTDPMSIVFQTAHKQSPKSGCIHHELLWVASYNTKIPQSAWLLNYTKSFLTTGDVVELSIKVQGNCLDHPLEYDLYGNFVYIIYVYMTCNICIYIYVVCILCIYTYVIYIKEQSLILKTIISLRRERFDSHELSKKGWGVRWLKLPPTTA